MPLYTSIGGVQKEIGALYLGVGGAAREVSELYAGVGGAAKEIFSSGYKWDRYSLKTMWQGSRTGSSSTFSTSGLSYPILLSSGWFKDSDGKMYTSQGIYTATSLSQLRSNYSSYRYTQFLSAVSDTATVYYISSIPSFFGNPSRYAVAFTTVYSQEKDTYIDTVKAKDLSAYPENGAQGDYWYILQT